RWGEGERKRIKIRIRIKIKMRGVGVDGDTEAFAAEHEPDDAEFPILEAVDLRVRTLVEVVQGAGGDEILAATLAHGEEERDVSDLFGQDVDGAVNPDDLLVGVVEDGGGGIVKIGGAEEVGRGAWERGSVGA